MKDRRIITAIPKNGARLDETSPNAPIQSSELLRLFVDDLRDIYWVEKALTNVVPKMIKDATSPELVDALKGRHAKVTTHVARVEQVFGLIGEKAVDKKSDAALGLIRHAVETMDSFQAGVMCDAAIISAALKIEHYEIAIYKTLRQFAEKLGLIEVVSLLETTLNEEIAATEELSLISAEAVKVKAAPEVVGLDVR